MTKSPRSSRPFFEGDHEYFTWNWKLPQNYIIPEKAKGEGEKKVDSNGQL